MSVKTVPTNAAGTTLGYKLGGSSTYTNLVQLVDFEFGGVSTEKIETTTLASTIMTYIPSIPDPGELTLSVYAVQGDPGVVELQVLSNSPQVVAWQVQFSDGSSPTTGSTATFSGFISNYAAKGFAIGSTPTADVTIQVSGLISYTPGS